MIRIEKTDIFGWESAIRGMRNPMNSWDKSDSNFECRDCDGCYYINDCNTVRTKYIVDTWCNHQALRIGENDLSLMKKLVNAGSDHSKFMRMINVTADITAPLYWWKEYDTYKVGTVANSCSTMHKIHDKEFTLDDFSREHLFDGIDRVEGESDTEYYENPTRCLHYVVGVLNHYRNKYLETKDKRYWWQLIQLLPTSYNQKRTVQLNYAVLRNMYFSRRNHKLDEWHTFCEWVEQLPYAKELICE